MKLDQALIAGSNCPWIGKTIEHNFMICQEYLRQVGQIYEDCGPLMQLLNILNLGRILHMWIFLEINGSSCILITVQKINTRSVWE